MVCKEDVVSWFKSLKSHSRIDVMCNLFNLCLPFELRFLGTCLEDLGKRDFHDLKTTESGANNPSELSSPDLQCISDKRARTKLALYISLLHSCNYACSNGYYKILANIEEVNVLIKCNGVSSADDEVLEELLIIYTLALNHPAFNFDQKLFLGHVFTKLRQEEERRYCLKRTRPIIQGSTGMEAIDKAPIQLQAYPPSSSPEQLNLPMQPTANHCPPLSPAALTGDPLVSIADPLMGFMPYSLMSGYPAMMLPPPMQEPVSPLVSRNNSPNQSNSPSRAGSPGKPKPMPPSFTRPPPAMEHPPFFPPKFASWDQLRNFSDDELRDCGWNSQSINQFRNLDARHYTNGYTMGPKKPPQSEPDAHKDNGVHNGPLRRYNSVDGPLNHPPFIINPPSCLCVMSYPHRHQGNTKSLPPHFINHLRSMSLDHDAASPRNSSTSDSASDHSPPDTPGLSGSTDRVMQVALPETWEEPRIPEVDERRVMAGHGRARGTSRGMPPQSRGRGHHPPHRRRENHSVNGTVEERKVFPGGSDSGGGMAFSYGQFPLPNHQQFIHTYPFTTQNVLRLPFPHLNGEMVYHSVPPPFFPARPTPVPFSPQVPPPKIVSCYNCGSQGHTGSDCPEATIEEITNKGQYKIDYSNNGMYPKHGDCPTVQDK